MKFCCENLCQYTVPQCIIYISQFRAFQDSGKMNFWNGFSRIVLENPQIWGKGHQIRNGLIFPDFLVYNTSYFVTFFLSRHSRKKIFPRSIAPDWEQLLTNQSQIWNVLIFPHFLVYNIIRSRDLYGPIGTAADKSGPNLECPDFSAFVYNIFKSRDLYGHVICQPFGRVGSLKLSCHSFGTRWYMGE